MVIFNTSTGNDADKTNHPGSPGEQEEHAMKFTYNSTKLGLTFEFYAPAGGGYIRCATLGDVQICEGGKLMGDTMRAENEAQMEKQCRKWMKKYIARETCYC